MNRLIVTAVIFAVFAILSYALILRVRKKIGFIESEEAKMEWY